MVRRPEQAIQRAVFEHLRWRGAKNIFPFHPANGGWRTAVEGAILKSMGVVPGVPDVIIIQDGRVFALELKAKGGPTPAQLSAHDLMRAAGATVGVAVGVDQAVAWLEARGLLRSSKKFGLGGLTGTAVTAGDAAGNCISRHRH